MIFLLYTHVTKEKFSNLRNPAKKVVVAFFDQFVPENITYQT